MLGHFWSQMGHFWTPGTLYGCLEMAKKGVLINSPMYEEGFGALGASFMHKCGHSNQKSDRKGQKMGENSHIMAIFEP